MIVLAVGLTPVATLGAAEITQHFPADGPAGPGAVHPVGASSGDGESCRRLRDVGHPQRLVLPGPGRPEVRVLGDTRLADVFVPYHNGTRITTYRISPSACRTSVTRR